jgi:SNF2 family DNA or RNA helicase
MLFDFTRVNHTPVLFVKTDNPEFGRILGATQSSTIKGWLYPAYLPFLPKVLADIGILDKQAQYTPAAEAYLKEVRSYEQWRDVVANTHFPTRSRDHQLDGTAELLTYHRWMLQWGMGVGKTKIAIDTINILRTPTLVLCPRVAVDNWMLEIDNHGGGQLRAMTLKGASKEAKMKELLEMPLHDVVITTYDTARLYGVPSIPPAAVTLLKNAHRALHPDLRTALMSLNDAQAQERLITEWLAGRNNAEVIAEIRHLREGRSHQWLMDWDYQTLICDESHRIKRIQSSRTAAVLQMSAKASRRILLSGTPIQGNPLDAFPQLKFLAPYIVKEDYRKFKQKYTVASPYNENAVVGYKNLHILNRLISSISSKRELEECLSLPEQVLTKVNYSLSPAQKRAYNQAVEAWIVDRADRSAQDIVNAASRISKLLQICSGFVYTQTDTGCCDTCPHLTTCIEGKITPGTPRCFRKEEIGEIPRETQWFDPNPKMEALKDLLEDIIPTNKVIIWAVFTAELDLVEKLLQREKIGYVRVDGSNTGKVANMAAKFNSEPECMVYLAQISTGISITLNAAKYMIYYSRNWSPDDREQSMARNHRLGQTQTTGVYDLCAFGTVEAQQLTALNCKQNITQLLTDKVDCLVCSRYSACVNTGIEPWDDGCIYKKSVSKVTARAESLEED